MWPTRYCYLGGGRSRRGTVSSWQSVSDNRRSYSAAEGYEGWCERDDSEDKTSREQETGVFDGSGKGVCIQSGRQAADAADTVCSGHEPQPSGESHAGDKPVSRFLESSPGPLSSSSQANTVYTSLTV